MAEVKQLRDYQVDERMDIFVLLKEVDPRVTQQGKRYLAVSVADRSMEIRGMKWDATQEEADTLQAGMVIFMTAVRQVYQDKPQLKILAMRPTRVGEPQDPSDFMNAAPMKASEMEEEVSALIFQITNATWQRIVRHLLSKYHDEFYKYPAAKSNHHAFAGGLGFHSLSIARLAQAIVKQYPGVNASLLYAGALLHDLGKVIELTGPIATQYTTAGNLIGHIVLIDEQIVLAANELHLDLYSEDMLVLRHTVLAHHGLMEYGSPVRPLIKEANILHQLDELDANMQSFDNALAETEPGEFSQRQWALDNRNVYKPDLK
ncbi:HD domain-containing protein [Weissella cibaria]|uniref:3'-5' exoribonuclease YhaM family protein n=1 Tax=Weissella cibaria TaxID=137591 RepID=UPI001192484A|nr:HD domain-containing protein [Weissella cibaria]MCA1356497.1 HD domain-containing protein [Weissella cibaria]MCT8400678.1 HD domain-containing protein [Weissella cibaria]MDQ2125990.1 HD domain-containing protein [Weissella cibaria]MDQ2158857.1 HD domain-containing protein [Weissella cibaria]NFA03145.1 HD domain-containing protein [Weissella cibaria]